MAHRVRHLFQPGIGSGASPEPEPEPTHPAGLSFWQALNDSERAALESVAIGREFSANQLLMRQGDRADYVMVITWGRTRVYVHQNGRDHLLAERGPGDLIGERGGLSPNVRSASVVALETVWVMQVSSEDFRAFVDANKRVVDIVESQVYDRLTEPPAGSQTDGPGTRSDVEDGPVATTSRPRANAADAPTDLPPRRLHGEPCTVVLSDVVGFGAPDRTDKDRSAIREGLGEIMRLGLLGLPGIRSEDRGDGQLVIAHHVPTEEILARLLGEIPTALARYNDEHDVPARFRLRLAVSMGPITNDSQGVSGEAIIHASRLIEAPLFKTAMKNSSANLGLITSEFVYEAVVWHLANRAERDRYRKVEVQVKESATFGWIRLCESPARIPHHIAPQFYRSALAPMREQHLGPVQGLAQVGLGGQLVGLRQGDPAQRSVQVLRADRVRGLGGHKKTDVGVLMGGLTLTGWHVHHGDLLDPRVRPGRQIA